MSLYTQTDRQTDTHRQTYIQRDKYTSHEPVHAYRQTYRERLFYIRFYFLPVCLEAWNSELGYS